MRLGVIAFLGIERFASFHVDLVAGLLMTGLPDVVSPLVPVELSGVVTASYAAYPLADHVADKVYALLETHERSSGLREPSTRFRDLADLAIFAHSISVGADELGVALASEAERRCLSLPERFAVPGGRNWPSGYARVARDAPQLRERDLASAVETVAGFIDPVLTGVAQGRQWDPARLRWCERGEFAVEVRGPIRGPK
jgi:hypothetical protein